MVAALDHTRTGEIFDLYWDYEDRGAVAEKLYSDYASGFGVFCRWIGKLGNARALAVQFDRITGSEQSRRMSLEERYGEAKPSGTEKQPGETDRNRTEEPQKPFEWKLNKETVKLEGVYTQQISYVRRPRQEKEALRRKFNSSVRRNFLIYLSGNVEALKAAGLTDAEISKMRKGKLPKEWQVHHILPLDDSGTNDFSNLVLIINDPYHKVLTNYQNDNTSSFEIGVPYLIEWPVFHDPIYYGKGK